MAAAAPVFPAPRRDPAESLVAFERRAFHDRVVWHDHGDVELTLVLEGQGLRGVGDSLERYEGGDLCLVSDGTAHGWDAPTGSRVHAMVVHFPRAVTALAAEIPELAAIDALLRRARAGVVFDGRTRDTVVDQVIALREEPSGSWRRPLRLLETLGTMAASIEGRALSRAPDPTARGLDPRLAIVRAYLEESLDQVSHKEAAARVRLTPSAFSRFFRRTTGRTFESYADDLRIDRACRALLSSQRNISDIAFDAGFGSLAHFNRRFRRAKGMAPSAYRRLFARG